MAYFIYEVSFESSRKGPEYWAIWIVEVTAFALALFFLYHATVKNKDQIEEATRRKS